MKLAEYIKQGPHGSAVKGVAHSDSRVLREAVVTGVGDIGGDTVVIAATQRQRIDTAATRRHSSDVVTHNSKVVTHISDTRRHTAATRADTAATRRRHRTTTVLLEAGGV